MAALNFFVSSVNTIVNKTMEDSISTVRQYEVSRVEYDAYRSDLEYYATAPKTEVISFQICCNCLRQAPRNFQVNQLKQAETLASFNNKKAEFEKLRSDVQIKLKFLDENRVKVTFFKVGMFISMHVTGDAEATSSFPQCCCRIFFWQPDCA